MSKLSTFFMLLNKQLNYILAAAGRERQVRLQSSSSVSLTLYLHLGLNPGSDDVGLCSELAPQSLVGLLSGHLLLEHLVSEGNKVLHLRVEKSNAQSTGAYSQQQKELDLFCQHVLMWMIRVLLVYLKHLSFQLFLQIQYLRHNLHLNITIRLFLSVNLVNQHGSQKRFWDTCSCSGPALLLFYDFHGKKCIFPAQSCRMTHISVLQLFWFDLRAHSWQDSVSL